MATTIKLKNGSGAPLAGDLVQGEPALDLTNKRLYTENASGTVIEVGTNPTSLTTGTFTSTGIDDNATSTAITIDSDGDVGIGVSPAFTAGGSRKLLQIANSTNGAQIAMSNSSSESENPRIFSDSTNLGFATAATGSGAFQFYTAGTERMRITAAGSIGLNTTNPQAPFVVSNTSNERNLEMGYSGGTSANYIQAYDRDASAFTDLEIYSATTAFHTGSSAAERMRLDSSGNVGIGTTSPNTKLDVIGSSTNGSGVVDTLRLRNTGTTLGDGARIQFTAGSSTSGAAIASTGVSLNSADLRFYSGGNTERMRIDSSGNVSIGATTSNNRKLSVTGSGDLMELRSTNAGTGGAQLDFIHNSASPADGDSIGIINFSNATAQFANITGKSSSVGSQYGELHFGTRNAGTYNFSNMVLDASGNVGIGTTPSGWGGTFDAIDAGSYGSFSADNDTTFITNNAYFNGTNWIYKNSNLAGRYRQQQGLHVWDTAASGTAGGTLTWSEAMRIDSSGTVNIGTTAAGGTSGNVGVGFTQIGRTISNCDADWNYEIFGAQGNRIRFFTSAGGGTQVGSITVTTSTTAYNTSSDQRLKENIVDAPAGNIDDIRVRSFDWKADGSHQTYGMIAQELVDVAPEAVTKGKTEDDIWSVDYSKLVPMMIKEIQDLKAEVAALKGA